MSKKSNRQYAQALYIVTEDLKGKSLDEALTGFVKVLVKDHKLKQANNIIAEFEKYSKEKAGIKNIEITSAFELDNKIIKKIKSTFGEKVEEETEVDENILGGIKVRVGDTILDASLKTQLNRLKQSLNK
jgi:F-type H+-transporting ATPase subunit delta